MRTHGMSGTAESNIWRGIKARCNNKNDKAYESYGGRGIIVCERWSGSFLNFLEDMGPRPSKHHSIDRIDNDGNYEPGNCKWATAAQQQRNRRDTVFVIYHGEKHILIDLLKRVPLKKSTFLKRIKRGATVEEAIEAPILTKRQVSLIAVKAKKALKQYNSNI